MARGGSLEPDAPFDLDALLQAGFRYAIALVRDAALAQDLLQEACLAVVRAGAGFSRAYLFTSIRTRRIDQARRASLVVLSALDPEAHPDPGPGASDLERFVADRDALERGLETLREEEREAIFLVLVEDFTAAEVAELTGRPRNTVLSLIHRGKAKLRRALVAPPEGKVAP